jgi:type IV secretory pathway VirB2 component (pilin)
VLGRAVRTLLILAAVITGTQWAVVATVHDWRAVLAVLGVPALLAAAPLVRTLTITPTTTWADRRGWSR